MGFFSWAFLVFLMKESKKRRQKQRGKLMAKSCSQPVSLPGARPLMNPPLLPFGFAWKFKISLIICFEDIISYVYHKCSSLCFVVITTQSIMCLNERLQDLYCIV